MKRRESKRQITHLATRVFNTPLLIHQRKGDVLLSVLGPRLGLSAESIPVVSFDDDNEIAVTQNEYKVEDGIATISICGTLVKRASGMNAMSGMTSYEELTAQIQMAAADDDVQAILFDVDSPGGEAAGMSALSDLIYELRGTKPMVAVSNDDCYSAAYGLASAADRVFVTRDGGVGSIGCYMLHCDQSGANKKAGLSFTYIFAGDHKIDGNPMEPLSADVLDELQGEVNRCRDSFVSLVARNRNVTPQQIFDTQAGCFYAEQALPLLADQIGGLTYAETYLRGLLAMADDSDDDEAGVAASDPMMSQAFEIKNINKTQISSGTLSFPSVVIEPPMPVAALSPALGYGHKVLKEMDPERDDLSVKHNTKVISRVERFPEARSSASPDNRRISMLVVPYEQQSCDLGGFREVYQRGCFAQGLSDDPRALAHHNPEYVLGRESAGTARFWEDAAGVHVECDAPETSWADDLLVSMRRGDITQASAAFFILQHRWEQRSGQKVRIVERALLREASVASFPAYESTQAVVQPAPVAVAAQVHELENAAARLRLLRSA